MTRRGASATAGPARRTEGADNELVQAITRWFKANARDLPWRRNRGADGYAALVSEAMLQQTQVRRVVEAFAAFMRRFPTIEALATADEQDVLAAWSGLGYYRRARNLHAAARLVVDRLGGEIPRAAQALRELPGVGRYTAGSIASIVFGESAAIVDGNVARVLLRVRGRRARPELSTTQRWLWREAQRLVDAADDPGAFNEGLMELGATICTPATPRCVGCPIRGECRAFADGNVDRIPMPRRAAPRRDLVHHSIVVRRGDRVLLWQRPDRGLWSRMWQPPTVESETALAPATMRRRLIVPIERLRRRGAFVHVTTHRTIRFVVFTAGSRSRGGRWVPIGELDGVPMSNAARRAIAMAIGEC